MAGTGRRVAGDEVFLTAVLAGHTVAQAARLAHISERSGYRRVREPGFRARLAQLRSDMLAQAAGKLAGVMLKAAQRLEKLLDSGNEPVALGACRVVIEQATKMHEMQVLEQRLAELEARLADTNRGG